MLAKKKSENVGRVFYSPYFETEIMVVKFYSDDNWYFSFKKDNVIWKSGSKLSYFEDNRLERTAGV